jgi:hypothetical protein
MFAIRAAALVSIALAVVSAVGCGKKDDVGGRDIAPEDAPTTSTFRVEVGTDWVSGSMVVNVRGASLLDAETLMSVVIVATTDERRKIDFNGWRQFTDNRAATLVDDLGNHYRTKPPDLAVDGLLSGRWNELPSSKNIGYGAGVVHSNRPRAEILLFDAPIPAAAYLDLDLSGRAVGLLEPIRFRIPRSAWEPAKPTPKAPVVKLPKTRNK